MIEAVENCVRYIPCVRSESDSPYKCSNEGESIGVVSLETYEYLGKTPNELLLDMRTMFDQKLPKIDLWSVFEKRSWEVSEHFKEYVHNKIIIVNRIPIDNEEIIDYLLEGIPLGISLRDQARLQRFESTESLLKAFEKIL